MPIKHITSPHNALIRKAEQLMRKSRARRQEGLFIVEGQREVRLCIEGGYVLEHLLVCPDILDVEESELREELINLIGDFGQAAITTVSPKVYSSLAYRGSVEGVIAFAKARNHTLADFKFPKKPLLLVAEAPEKPGNIGAILRTADASGIDGVIIADERTDLYNPNVIRSSLGCVFNVQTAIASTSECIAWCQKNHIDIYAATLQNSNRYDLEDYSGATAIALGTEATGISEEFRRAARQNINIPMRGKIDSMNLSVSAAILIYEAVKQRDFS